MSAGLEAVPGELAPGQGPRVEPARAGKPGWRRGCPLRTLLLSAEIPGPRTSGPREGWELAVQVGVARKQQ